MQNYTNIIKSQATQMHEYFDKIQIKLDTDTEFQNSLSRLNNLIKHSFTLLDFDRAIYFTGIGKNDTIAKKTANMFRSLNFNAHHISPVDAMHGDMGLLNDEDIIIAISKSGNTAELIHFLKYVESFRRLYTFGVQIGDAKSSFDDHTQHVFKLPKITEIDEWDLVPTMSNISTQLFLDLVGIHCSQELMLSKSDFIKSHPGGAIGAS